jgi:hypothetical protein
VSSASESRVALNPPLASYTDARMAMNWPAMAASQERWRSGRSHVGTKPSTAQFCNAASARTTRLGLSWAGTADSASASKATMAPAARPSVSGAGTMSASAKTSTSPRARLRSRWQAQVLPRQPAGSGPPRITRTWGAPAAAAHARVAVSSSESSS